METLEQRVERLEKKLMKEEISQDELFDSMSTAIDLISQASDTLYNAADLCEGIDLADRLNKTASEVVNSISTILKAAREYDPDLVKRLNCFLDTL